MNLPHVQNGMMHISDSCFFGNEIIFAITKLRVRKG
jgi:hypothetical protein